MIATGAMGLVFLVMVPDNGPGVASVMAMSFILLLNCLNVLFFVGFAALAMRICDKAVSATQFGLYMASANLGASLAAGVFGPIFQAYDYAGVLIVAAAGMFVACFVFAVVGGSQSAPVTQRPIVD